MLKNMFYNMAILALITTLLVLILTSFAVIALFAFTLVGLAILSDVILHCNKRPRTAPPCADCPSKW
jgi:hypothetical protein